MQEMGKNEFLLMKNLLKPVKIIDRPVTKPDFEFETVKLRKTESTDNKIQEKNLLANNEPMEEHEFSKVRLRKTKSSSKTDDNSINPVPRTNDIKRNNNKETLLENASILRKKSEESCIETSGEIVDNRRDTLNNIKLATKEFHKETYQLKEEWVENTQDKVKIPSCLNNDVRKTTTFIYSSIKGRQR